MNNSFQVGVTGGIGAGKSTVTKILTILGFPVYDSDSRAKQLMNSDNELREAIIAEFGEQSFQNGELNRTYLATSVFNNPEKLARLNSLVHPSVGKDYLGWMQNQKSSIVIKEAALLFEAGIAENLDFVIVVSAPVPKRIDRVVQRDNRTEEQVVEIMDRQWPFEKVKELADGIIVNDEETPLIPQVLEMVDIIKRKAGMQNANRPNKTTQ